MARPSRAGALTTQKQALRERPRERTPQASCLAGAGIASHHTCLSSCFRFRICLRKSDASACSCACIVAASAADARLRVSRALCGSTAACSAPAALAAHRPTYLLPRRRLGAPPLYLPPLGLAQLLHLPLQSRRPVGRGRNFTRPCGQGRLRKTVCCLCTQLAHVQASHTGCRE